MRRLVITLAIVLLPATTSAQSSGSGDVANLLTDLILRGIVLPGGDLPGNPHAGHFTLLNPTFGGSQAASIPSEAAIRAVLAFNDRMTSQFANFPLGSSTGGFSFTFDESAGTYTRGSNSFGPAFSERSRTIGRKKLSAGFNYQHSSFDTFGDVELGDGSLTFFLPHTDCCSPAAPPPSSNVPGLEGDIMQAALVLKATTDTFVFLANYGVTDKLDIGVALPIIRVDLDATVQATIIRLATADTPNVHTFAQGANQTRSDFSGDASAAGIGDILLRSKYNIVQNGETGFAVAIDLRLPTGDEDDLLGLGAFQSKIFRVLSAGNDRFATHANLGFTLSGTGDVEPIAGFQPLGVSDEFNYSGGVQWVAHPRITVIGDILGRTLIDAGQVEEATQTFQYRAGAGSAGTVPLQTSSMNPLTGQPYSQLALSDGNLNLILGAIGAKVNLAPNLLISGNVLFPFTKGGLRDTLTFAFGLDYAF